MLRGEVNEPAKEAKPRGKPQYRTAQDDLRDAELREEAAAAAAAEEAEDVAEPVTDGPEARNGDGNAESSEEEDAGILPSLFSSNCI